MQLVTLQLVTLQLVTLQFLIKRWKNLVGRGLASGLASGLIGSSLLLLISPALAQYSPPRGGRPPITPTTTTGRRGGCTGDQAVTLTALAPQSHMGHTMATHPTMSWFVPPTEPLPLEFYLYEYDSNNNRRLVYSTVLESEPGIMALSLPTDRPGLQAGRTYNWVVALLCNPNHPSTALVASADMAVTEAAPSLNMALNAAGDQLTQARLYAEAGLWYDAIQLLVTAEETSAVQELRAALLRDLIQLEEGGNSEQSNRLQQVLMIEQQVSQ